MLLLLISFSIWEALFFSSLNKKHLSFQLRKVVLISYYGSLREAIPQCTLFFFFFLISKKEVYSIGYLMKTEAEQKIQRKKQTEERKENKKNKRKTTKN